MNNKVEYGISRCRAYPINFDNANGVSYNLGTPFLLSGAVRLILEPQEEYVPAIGSDGLELSRFYKNKGVYQGELELTNIPPEFYILIGEKVDANGAIYEDNKDTSPKYFCLLGQFEGSETPTRFAFYRVIAGKPTLEYKTNTEKLNPTNKIIPLTALPRIYDGKSKVKFEKRRNEVIYNNWFNQVYTIE